MSNSESEQTNQNSIGYIIEVPAELKERSEKERKLPIPERIEAYNEAGNEDLTKLNKALQDIQNPQSVSHSSDA